MIISIANIKGGVGKSTITCNLAVEASNAGQKVLIVDTDTQASSLAWRAIRGSDDIKAMAVTTATLHKDLPSFNDQFDLILVDAGGRESTVFRSAIMAADLIIVPITPSQYDIWATTDTIAIMKEASVYKDIKAKFLFNQVIMGTKVAAEALSALEEINQGTDFKTLKTMLYSRVSYKNSISRGQGVSEYEPGGKASLETAALYGEIMNGGK